MESPFSEIRVPLDVFFTKICSHMTLQDMGRMTCVSKGWLASMVTDEAWSTIKSRILAECPEWEAGVFAHFPWKVDSHGGDPKRAKLRNGKKSFVMPSGGTRYVVRRFIARLLTIKGMRSMCIPSKEFADGTWVDVKKYVVQRELFIPFFRLYFSHMDGFLYAQVDFPGLGEWMTCDFVYLDTADVEICLPVNTWYVRVSETRWSYDIFARTLRALLDGGS